MNNYYSKIVELPLNKFIEIKVDPNGNLAPLIISGMPTPEELAKAWEEIQQEYADIMGDAEYRLYTKMLKDLTLLTISYNTVQKVIPFLIGLNLEAFLIHAAENKEIFDEIEKQMVELNKILHTPFKFNPYEPEKFRGELKRALNQSKSLKMRIDLKESEFEAVREKNENKETKPTKEYFYSILIELSDHAKIALSADNMTVFEYCERVRRYNQYRKHLEDQANKTKK